MPKRRWQDRTGPLSGFTVLISPANRHDVGAGQFPLATESLAPDDQAMAAETAPGREISQARWMIYRARSVAAS